MTKTVVFYFYYYMRIIDLTESYRNKYIRDSNRDEYESSFPELFSHYYKFWARKDDNIATVDINDIQIRQQWIKRLLEKLERKLEETGIETGGIDLVYFIGVGSTNGHAFKHKDKFCVWLPLETYTSEMLVDVFVTHEIAHALHYKNSPSFYFNTKDEQDRLSRTLITEGLATYLTAKLFGVTDNQALWADYLSETDAWEWYRMCHAEEYRLFGLIADNYHKSDHGLDIFYIADPDSIYSFRSGYYAGLGLIEWYAVEKNLTAAELLNLPRDIFEKDIFDLIQAHL